MQYLKEQAAGLSNEFFTKRHPAFDNILLYLNIFVILVISLAEIYKGSEIWVIYSTPLAVPCFAQGYTSDGQVPAVVSP